MNWPKILIGTGVVLIVLGLVFPFLSRVPWFGKLPGDILIRKGNFTFYFPAATCLAVSLLLTLVFSLFHKR